MSDVSHVPDRGAELTDLALDWLHSTAARTVALKLVPLLLPVLGGAAAWLQDVLGINMSPTVAAAFVASVVLGAAGVALAWVLNHGKGATTVGTALLELEKLYEAGRRELNAAGATGDPQAPIGIR